MIARTLLLLFFLCLGIHLQAQIIATTTDGRKVVLKEDGTWQYLEDFNAERSKAISKKGKDKAKGKSKGNKAASTAAAVPVEKKATMADIKCEQIVESAINPQTQEEVRQLTGDMVISEGENEPEFKVLLGVTSSKTYTWNLSIKGQKGCATETPRVKLTFQDGSDITLKVANDYVCDKTLSLYLSKGLGNKSDLKTLRSKALKSIWIETKQGAIEEDLTHMQAITLQKAFNCLDGK